MEKSWERTGMAESSGSSKPKTVLTERERYIEGRSSPGEKGPLLYRFGIT